MQLTPDDIIRIGPEVIERLHVMLPFEKGVCWVPSAENGTFPPVEISRRQRERASEAFSTGRPFWDIVGSSVIIPISYTSSTNAAAPQVCGAFVLSGVSRAVTPEEPDRWLPLLCSWVETTLSMCKTRMLRVDPGDPLPPCIARAVTTSHSDLNVLHLCFGRGRDITDYENFVPVVEKLLRSTCEKGRDLRMELAGYGVHDLWIIVHGLGEPFLSSAIRRIFPSPAMKKAGIQQAIVHTFDCKLSRENALERMSEQAASTEEIAGILGMPVFSKVMLSDIEKRFECNGLKGLFNFDLSMYRGRRYAAAFAHIASPDLNKLSPGHDCFDHVHRAASGTCILFVKKVTRREHLKFDLKEWGRNIQEVLGSRGEGRGKVPVGVAASWQQTLSSVSVPGASFWAYVHAFMLRTGMSIVYDAVTWQVRGDELMASGALMHACRAFRKALVLDDTHAEIWNSLGVCLARLGRRREAEKAFLKASGINPDDFMTFYNLCGIQHALRDYSRAEASCRRAIEIRSGDTMALTRLGQVLLDSGKEVQAVECLEQASAGETPPPAVWRLLGTALYRQGKWPDAKRALEKALALKPEDAAARTRLALGYAEYEKDYATARRLSQGFMSKSRKSAELGRISARLSSIFAESSLDKEKAGG